MISTNFTNCLLSKTERGDYMYTLGVDHYETEDRRSFSSCTNKGPLIELVYQCPFDQALGIVIILVVYHVILGMFSF